MTIAPSLPRPHDDWALFLDVDGTLIEIADAPDRVTVDDRVQGILTGLDARFSHAVALVSGRPIATLDALFAPLRLASAGLHGLERRARDGTIDRCAADIHMDEVRRDVAAFARRDPGLLVEDKGLSVALHYRRAPGCEDDAVRFATALVARLDDGLALQRGKMVLEFRPPGPDKGDVVASFMAAPPFRGRIPVFIGDDVTDEHGFAAVNRLGGHSIRVGNGAATEASWQIDGVANLLDWLDGMAAARSAPGSAPPSDPPSAPGHGSEQDGP